MTSLAYDDPAAGISRTVAASFGPPTDSRPFGVTCLPEMPMPTPINDTDLASNLIDIRHYLNKHVRATGQEVDSAPAEPSASEAYRYAEYADGRRPRFAKTDLILIGIVLGIGALIAAFIIY